MATRMQQRRGTAAQWISTNSGNGPILAAGEIGFESDTNKFKIGDGVNHWVDLTYFTDAESITTALNNIIDGAPEALNTLNELAAALGDDANFLASLATETYVDTAVANSTFDAASAAGAGLDWNATTDQFDIDGSVATESYVDTAVQAHSDDTTSIHGITDTAALATKEYADSAVGTHSADTTSVHGIANTLDLATKDYADGAVTVHSADTTNVHGILDTADLATNSYVSTSISTHNDDTTGVHGISDTAELATKTYADGAVSTHASDTTLVHGIADTSELATKTYADSAVSTAVSNHQSDTTSVHGIADTSVLATTTNVSDAQSAAETYADSAVSTHNLDTTSVHGIADTSVLATATDIQEAKDYADDQIDAHVAVTTNVHGIADTTKIVFKDAVSTTLDGALVVDGDFTVNGTNFSASATTITIEDNLLQLAHQNASNVVDLGIVVAYNDGATKHSGIVRDVSDSKWKLFKDVATEPTTTVDFGGGSLDDLVLNNITTAGVVFTDGTQTKEGVASRTPIIQKTDSYTLSSLTERDSLIEVSKATATTITIPGDSTVDYPIGTSIDILQTSTGQVTIVGAGGVTVNATPGLKLRTQWSSATLFKRAANTWVVMGDLSA